ncbi:hypothetical protein B7R25_04490 [Subtercola boreus]|uniref:Uncharacterized protein n=1 Tax=Subtercola boreus TaxID=120213 RepID=A0A3E0WEE8_9MICO|nr:hypothetical protein B7R24_04480 [Subtercola boreus]RFA22467.1 hypothetical protein B7R23_04475 [Subtercola boreus]RFA28482.1 hypothetical protein B7R25_04490 [Subtercola boreus]
MPIWILPPQATITGARAMSGTVWLRISQGSTARSATWSLCMSRAMRKPTTDPMAQPTAATPRLLRAAPMTAIHTGGEPAEVLTGSTARVSMSTRCGIERSSVFGRMLVPKNSTPATGPMAL